MIESLVGNSLVSWALLESAQSGLLLVLLAFPIPTPFYLVLLLLVLLLLAFPAPFPQSCPALSIDNDKFLENPDAITT